MFSGTLKCASQAPVDRVFKVPKKQSLVIGKNVCFYTERRCKSDVDSADSVFLPIFAQVSVSIFEKWET